MPSAGRLAQLQQSPHFSTHACVALDNRRDHRIEPARTISRGLATLLIKPERGQSRAFAQLFS
jgi:hypothetical protein